MSELRDFFNERRNEVNAYMDFLDSISAQAQSGAPRFDGMTQGITPEQQKLLYASVYLQLYNLVEATMTLCVESVAKAAADDAKWTPDDLSEPLRREWVRTTARTHVDLNYANRLEAAINAVDHVVGSQPVGSTFAIDKGGGGNWDDEAIEQMSGRLGCKLKVSAAVRSSVKRPFKDDLGPLALVKSRRNDLAHGSMSFAESAAEVTVSDLQQLVDAVLGYLGEVVSQFDAYVAGYEYLSPEKRPTTKA
ncbi:MAG TPA: MAE_28990/MAE_18760 family HEPN-like nuclease [Solirubrobacterales bacterium]|nr:MAE_28990/MAE_18760 family HEPN-like nuclease [Solirubrobacterales bacterium]